MSMWKKPQPKPKLDLSKYQSIVPFLFSDPAQYEDFLLQFAYKDPDTVFKILTNGKSHTEFLHIDTTLGEDISRIFNEGVMGAGSFLNDQAASVNVMDAIVDNLSEITAWMKSPRSAFKDRIKAKSIDDDKYQRLTLHYTSSENVGSAWKQEKGRVVEYVTPCVTLVLGRDMRSYVGFKPITAFPEVHTELAQPTGRSFSLTQAIQQDIIISRDPYIQTAIKYRPTLSGLSINTNKDQRNQQQLRIVYETQYNSSSCAYFIYYHGPGYDPDTKRHQPYEGRDLNIVRVNGSRKTNITFEQLRQQCPELYQEIENIKKEFLYNQQSWHQNTHIDRILLDKSSKLDKLADKIVALDEKEEMGQTLKDSSSQRLAAIQNKREELLQEAKVLYTDIQAAYPDKQVYDLPIMSYTAHVLAKRIAKDDYFKQLSVDAQQYAAQIIEKHYGDAPIDPDQMKQQNVKFQESRQKYLHTLLTNRPNVVTIDEAVSKTTETLQDSAVMCQVNNIANQDMNKRHEICKVISQTFADAANSTNTSPEKEIILK